MKPRGRKPNRFVHGKNIPAGSELLLRLGAMAMRWDCCERACKLATGSKCSETERDEYLTEESATRRKVLVGLDERMADNMANVGDKGEAAWLRLAERLYRLRKIRSDTAALGPRCRRIAQGRIGRNRCRPRCVQGQNKRRMLLSGWPSLRDSKKKQQRNLRVEGNCKRQAMEPRETYKIPSREMRPRPPERCLQYTAGHMPHAGNDAGLLGRRLPLSGFRLHWTPDATSRGKFLGYRT